uniref:tRNA(His) guanylyltransferase Thg1 family protein n=1 Tax=Chryseobacterium endophyticum TaxID=1854762 RepID=A0AAU6WUI3_9FLAO
MKFEEIEAVMRKNESLSEQYILPENYIIVRLDGKGFTKLTKEKLTLEKPFDARFGKVMTDTVKHLFNTGFKVIYGYTQSDEISLLIDKDDQTFSRKVRKINSVLAGEASAFSACSFRKSVSSTAVPSPSLTLICCWIISAGGRKMPTAIPFPPIATGPYGITALPQNRPPERSEKCPRPKRTSCCFSTASITTPFRPGRNAASGSIIKKL